VNAISAIPERVHLVGVGGIHMSGIARILRARGHTVSGSDLHLSPLTVELEEIGVTVSEGHAAEQIDEAQLIVYTSAAQADNPEITEGQRRGIETIKRAQMVARLMEGKKVIAVAGSHGKTTTSSLIAYMLREAGLSPTFMVGGESPDLGTNAEPGEGEYFVVEADEYDRAFLEYRPYVALITNLEPDHLDIYGSFEELSAAFGQFLSQVDDNGIIVACGDSPALRALLPQAIGDGTFYPVRAVSYGRSDDCDWESTNISQKGIDTSSFVIRFRKQVWGEATTHLAGVHNVVNSLGAIAVGDALGLDREAILSAVGSFRGVKRRFELIGEAAGVRVMDSYAHHPSEVRADLAAARARFPGRRIVCLFQPHTYTRTVYLLDEFRSCFRDCDVLYVADTYAAREDPAAGMNAERLAAEITDPPARYAGSVSEAAALVAGELREGDVFFTVGAGDVEKAGPMVLEALRRR
jgi:UDP-N-acetylmuramate--alanine ligase